MEEIFPLSQTPLEVKTQTKKKLYSLEKEDCYSIGEIAKKIQISESTVCHILRTGIQADINKSRKYG